MQALERKKTTAEQAVALEDGKAHPFRECSHSAQYFEILKSRRQLPISGTRQAFLDAYHENQVIVRVVNEVIRIRKQVKAQVEQLLDASLRTSDFSQKNYSINIRKALARSFFYHSALHSETRGDDMYTTVHNNHPAGIHPHSALIGCNHEWVIYSDFIHTGKQYIQTVTAIDAEWIVDLEYFQDSNLSYKHNGVLRQPGVKASLDKARTSLNKVRVTGQEATL
ncbi:hypothetical protein AK830_g7385 [Neonectria ditissima]|uniref:DEAD-box helicase OB fold domain-containing protein n=1 Tax=Neonectria ditissima TaxID=78410 RepID=A0A0N8H6J8_9HYPO|nr:hypothetical protein AK830_g7385 [Neonectria ditissima]